MSQFRRVIAIAKKDMESYYAKPPLVTWGLLFPAVLLLAVYLKDPKGYLGIAPGIVAMTALFGSTSMAAVTIAFEKRARTLERLLLAPVSHRAIVLGKALSAALFGLTTSGLLLLCLGVALGVPAVQPWALAAGLALGCAIFSLLGILASSLVREVFEAMTLMNFFRFPLLFVSGVFLTLDAMPGWLLPLAWLSPLTHVVDLLRFGIFGVGYFPSPWVPGAVCVVLLALSWEATGRVFRRMSTG